MREAGVLDGDGQAAGIQKGHKASLANRWVFRAVWHKLWQDKFSAKGFSGHARACTSTCFKCLVRGFWNAPILKGRSSSACGNPTRVLVWALIAPLPSILGLQWLCLYLQLHPPSLCPMRLTSYPFLKLSPPWLAAASPDSPRALYPHTPPLIAGIVQGLIYF